MGNQSKTHRRRTNANGGVMKWVLAANRAGAHLPRATNAIHLARQWLGMQPPRSTGALVWASASLGTYRRTTRRAA